MRPYQFVIPNIITRLFMAVAQAFLFIALGVAWLHVPIAGALLALGRVRRPGGADVPGPRFHRVGTIEEHRDGARPGEHRGLADAPFGQRFFPGIEHAGLAASGRRVLAADILVQRDARRDDRRAGPLGIGRDLIGMLVWSAVLVALAIATFRFQEREGFLTQDLVPNNFRRMDLRVRLASEDGLGGPSYKSGGYFAPNPQPGISRTQSQNRRVQSVSSAPCRSSRKRCKSAEARKGNAKLRSIG